MGNRGIGRYHSRRAGSAEAGPDAGATNIMRESADSLPAGTYQVSYQIHLTSAGSYHALPTTAHETYFPDVYGQSAGQIYKISAS